MVVDRSFARATKEGCTMSEETDGAFRDIRSIADVYHVVGVSRDEMDVERVQVFALVRDRPAT